jgi:hypothetical protein
MIFYCDLVRRSAWAKKIGAKQGGLNPASRRRLCAPPGLFHTPVPTHLLTTKPAAMMEVRRREGILSVGSLDCADCQLRGYPPAVLHGDAPPGVAIDACDCALVASLAAGR